MVGGGKWKVKQQQGSRHWMLPHSEASESASLQLLIQIQQTDVFIGRALCHLAILPTRLPPLHNGRRWKTPL